MNGKINWGILGTAGIAERALVPAIRQSRNGVLHAIASRDAEAARSWAGRLGFKKAYEGYGALLEDPEVDAVSRTTSMPCGRSGRPGPASTSSAKSRWP
jgi:predicted dehydrogenase